MRMLMIPQQPDRPDIDDLIFGDETGVIAIPKSKMLEVLVRSEEIMKHEEEIIAGLIKNG